MNPFQKRQGGKMAPSSGGMMNLQIMSALILLFFASACMKSGQTVRWSRAQVSTEELTPFAESFSENWQPCEKVTDANTIQSVTQIEGQLFCEIN